MSIPAGSDAARAYHPIAGESALGVSVRGAEHIVRRLTIAPTVKGI